LELDYGVDTRLVCGWPECTVEFNELLDLLKHIDDIHVAEQRLSNRMDSKSGFVCRWRACTISHVPFRQGRALVQHVRTGHALPQLPATRRRPLPRLQLRRIRKPQGSSTRRDGTNRVINPIQSNPIQSNPIQSNPIQSNPIQSNPIQSNPIQSNHCW